jgi:hypothetical protein
MLCTSRVKYDAVKHGSLEPPVEKKPFYSSRRLYLFRDISTPFNNLVFLRKQLRNLIFNGYYEAETARQA